MRLKPDSMSNSSRPWQNQPTIAYCRIGEARPRNVRQLFALAKPVPSLWVTFEGYGLQGPQARASGVVGGGADEDAVAATPVEDVGAGARRSDPTRPTTQMAFASRLRHSDSFRLQGLLGFTAVRLGKIPTRIDPSQIAELLGRGGKPMVLDSVRIGRTCFIGATQ